MTSRKMRVFVIFLVSIFPIFSGLELGKTASHLEKRSALTFPPDSLLQMNMGISLAEDLKSNKASIVLAFQQNAPIPKEAEPLLPPSLVVSGRQFSIYDHLRHAIGSYGLNGSECLRKMVCQIGEAPLFGGLLEDIITFVLSPSKHRSLKKDEGCLLESERLGRNGGNCTSAFPLCTRTPLDFISALIHL